MLDGRTGSDQRRAGGSGMADTTRFASLRRCVSPESEDAVAVDRLREHGAVFVGKTRTWEFAWHGRVDRAGGRGGAQPLASGLLNRPAAVAVARRQWRRVFAVFALGTDAGGSVRGPASCCGDSGYQAYPRPGSGISTKPDDGYGAHRGAGEKRRGCSAHVERGGGVITTRDPHSWPFPTSVDLRKTASKMPVAGS